MPVLKIYKNGAFEESPVPKRYDGSAWQNLTNMNVYKDNAWINILEAAPEIPELLELYIGWRGSDGTIVGASSQLDYNVITYKRSYVNPTQCARIPSSSSQRNITLKAYCDKSGAQITFGTETYVSGEPTLYLSTSEASYNVWVDTTKSPYIKFYGSPTVKFYIKELRIDGVLYAFPDFS